MTEASSDFSEGFSAAVAAAERGVVRVQAGGCRATTGSVWSADNLVIASQRALGDGEELRVTAADGEPSEAELVGRDPGLDLALLRVAGPALSPLEFAAPDALRVGQWVVALGRPGTAIRASARIVGVLGPELRTPLGGKLDRYIESDRGFPRGFAGGPLVDVRGRALGMNTAGVLRGADLTVPTPALQRAVGELLAHGKVRRGYLGVGVQPVRLPDALHAAAGAQRGLLVLSVEPGSPAAAAGLLQGDVIVELDGRAVADPRELSAALQDAFGRALGAKIVRAGAVQAITVTPGERP
jgi:S1-C subfamily serine protease